MYEGNPALVLNADYRPLSYLPLSLWSWQEAVKAVFLGRVSVISEYDETIRSPSFDMKLPSVIALREYVTQQRWPAFTRFNVFLRDGFSCQYCGINLPASELTFDHVVPRARGGLTTWENVVTACAPCNLAKGHKPLSRSGMSLMRPTYRPTAHQLQETGRSFPPNYLHESWRDFLYWDTELDLV